MLAFTVKIVPGNDILRLIAVGTAVDAAGVTCRSFITHHQLFSQPQSFHLVLVEAALFATVQSLGLFPDP